MNAPDLTCLHLQYKDKIFPPEERAPRLLPENQAMVREQLDRIKAEKAARRLARERADAGITDSAQSKDTNLQKGWFNLW
jgi:hypothetical protein